MKNVNSKIGTLIILEINKQLEIGDLYDHRNNGYGIVTDTILPFSGESHLDFAKRTGGKSVQPIIICDDEIKAGDMIYNVVLKSIYKCKTGLQVISTERKILVQSDQIPHDIIGYIIKDKIKSGDKVEVMMEQENVWGENNDGPGEALYYCFEEDGKTPKLKLKLDNNVAIINKYKVSIEEAANDHVKVETEKILKKLYKIPSHEYDIAKYSTIAGFMAGAKWQQEQNNK